MRIRIHLEFEVNVCCRQSKGLLRSARYPLSALPSRNGLQEPRERPTVRSKSRSRGCERRWQKIEVVQLEPAKFQHGESYLSRSNTDNQGNLQVVRRYRLTTSAGVEVSREGQREKSVGRELREGVEKGISLHQLWFGDTDPRYRNVLYTMGGSSQQDGRKRRVAL